MGYIEGSNRGQSAFWSLEDMVESESMARVIDQYIEVLNLSQLGFTRTTPSETGRPCYPPQAPCKLYVYGYENGIRSSRKLERLCKSWELVGGELVAVDGTKIKASNNKKMNFSRKKLTARLVHLDTKIATYLSEAEAL